MLMLRSGSAWGDRGRLYKTQTTGFLDELVPGGDTSAVMIPEAMSCVVERTQLNNRITRSCLNPFL